MRLRSTLLAVALLAVSASSAYAACGAGGAATPRGVSDPPLVIGDSVTLAARNGLLQMGAAVDARVCRRFGEGLDILRRRHLPSVVVIALGSNPSVSRGQVEQAISLVGGRLLAFVVPRELRQSRLEAAKALADAVKVHPEVTLLDWAGESAGHRDWFARDGIHPRGQGVTAFAQLIGGFLAATQLSDGEGFDTQPQTLSDDEVYPQLAGSLLRGAIARVETALLGRGRTGRTPAPPVTEDGPRAERSDRTGAPGPRSSPPVGDLTIVQRIG